MQRVLSRELYIGLTSVALLSLPLLIRVTNAQAECDPIEAAKPKSSGCKPGELRDDNALKLKLVWCPPGTFTMGSPPNEPERGFDEAQVSVTLSHGFWLGQTEVTQRQWQETMTTQPWKGKQCTWEGVNLAATYLTWKDATAFCQAFTASERRAGRLPADWQYALPTEAQWEYACRAGTTTQYWFGDDATPRLNDYAWWAGVYGGMYANDEKYAQKVGLTPANAWGLHDMHGNIWEWCQDEYHTTLPGGANPLRKSTQATPLRVLRSGSWPTSPEWLCRSASRRRGEPHYGSFMLGFRLALVPRDQ